MTRLILDTNALRDGQFSSSALQQWARALGEGEVDLVIPEVVVWEWAEHADSAYASLAATHRDYKVDPAVLPVPPLPEASAKSELISRIRGLISRPAVVWSPGEATWESAVRDQVLQTGVGERKQGVKTGAADAIVLACVAEQVEDRRGTEAVILATRDKGLRKACKDRFGVEVLLVLGTGDLLSTLIAFAPAEQDLLEATEEWLDRAIRSGLSSDLRAPLDTFAMGYTVRHASARDASFHELARLGRVDIVELHDLRVGQDGANDRVGLADVRLFADVHMTVLELVRTETGASEWKTAFDGTVTGGYVDLQLTVTFDTHWDVRSAFPTGPANIVFDDDGDESDDDQGPGRSSDSCGGFEQVV